LLLAALEAGATHHVAPAHDLLLDELADLVGRAGDRRGIGPAITAGSLKL